MKEKGTNEQEEEQKDERREQLLLLHPKGVVSWSKDGRIDLKMMNNWRKERKEKTHLEEEMTFSAAKTALGWKNGLFVVE